MKILKSIAILSVAAVILIAAPQNKKSTELAKVIKTGDKSSKLLIQTLGKQMKGKLKKGGTMAALDFCADEAYNITQKVNKRLPKGVTVKRISSKYRSPVNAPQGNEMAVLESFLKLKNSNIILPKQLVEQVDAKTYKYYKPLLMNNKACLKCHGKVKDVEIRRAIEKRYPLDTAMNYELGDLRGAVVVTVKRK